MEVALYNESVVLPRYFLQMADCRLTGNVAISSSPFTEEAPIGESGSFLLLTFSSRILYPLLYKSSSASGTSTGKTQQATVNILGHRVRLLKIVKKKLFSFKIFALFRKYLSGGRKSVGLLGTRTNGPISTKIFTWEKSAKINTWIWTRSNFFWKYLVDPGIASRACCKNV